MRRSEEDRTALRLPSITCEFSFKTLNEYTDDTILPCVYTNRAKCTLYCLTSTFCGRRELFCGAASFVVGEYKLAEDKVRIRVEKANYISPRWHKEEHRNSASCRRRGEQV